MSDPSEPEDGGYVAVIYRTDSNSEEALLCHRDDQAADGSDERWVILDDRFGRVLTWDALVLTGPVAYVGSFVDRRAA